MNEAGFSISLGTLAETLCGDNLTTGQLLTFLQRGQEMSKLLLLFLVL